MPSDLEALRSDFYTRENNNMSPGRVIEPDNLIMNNHISTFSLDSLPKPAAVLFDIDGTLIVNSSSHLPSSEYALMETLGVPLEWSKEGNKLFLSGRQIPGWIDRQLFTTAAAAKKIPFGSSMVNMVSEKAAEHMKAQWQDGQYPGELAPGAITLLDGLAQLGIPVGLATGHALAVAEAKMSRLGLKDYFDFTLDAGFGHHRNRVFVVRAAAEYLKLETSNIWLIGSTGAEMSAAKENGFIGIGVDSGIDFRAVNRRELEEAGAVVILPSLDELLPYISRTV